LHADPTSVKSASEGNPRLLFKWLNNYAKSKIQKLSWTRVICHRYLKTEKRTMKKKTLLMFALIVPLSFCLASPLMAQTFKTTFVPLGPGVPGVLYEPVTPGPKAEIAVIAMHTVADYLTFTACPELAKRGYRALCANCSTSKSGFVSDNDQNKMILNVKLAVAYLRKYPGIRKIALLGHSGGGGLMASYQNIAENGVSICQGPEKLVKCPDSLAGLPPADGLMLIDSNISGSAMALFSLDPAIVSEDNGQVLNPDLDMYNPQNGFNPKGSTYREDFRKKFFAKTRDRANQLIAKALDRLEKINAGKGNFKDDEPFIIPAGSYRGNRLMTQDMSLWAHTRNAWPLLHPDGTITTEIVHSVRVPRDTESPSPSLVGAGLVTTVRNFLSTFALRPTDEFGYDASSIYGIDYKATYSNAVFSVENITKPLLQMGMTGSHEYFSAETIRNHAKSADKTLAYVEGATHNFTPCKACAVAQGKPENYYGDTVKTLFDYIDGWLSKPGRL
jgi:pimeloyl-ACP methyl ester carboxylesterase